MASATDVMLERNETGDAPKRGNVLRPADYNYDETASTLRWVIGSTVYWGGDALIGNKKIQSKNL